MSYIIGSEGGQTALLPALLGDYVPADAKVRVIDALVDGLDGVDADTGLSLHHEVTGEATGGATKELLKQDALTLWPMLRAIKIRAAAARK